MDRVEFPACAGMNRLVLLASLIFFMSSRMRGDEPFVYAGSSTASFGVPRMRGDEPIRAVIRELSGQGSPHARG